LAQLRPLHANQFDTYTTLLNLAIVNNVLVKPMSVVQPNRVRCLVDEEGKFTGILTLTVSFPISGRCMIC